PTPHRFTEHDITNGRNWSSHPGSVAYWLIAPNKPVWELVVVRVACLHYVLVKNANLCSEAAAPLIGSKSRKAVLVSSKTRSVWPKKLPEGQHLSAWPPWRVLSRPSISMASGFVLTSSQALRCVTLRSRNQRDRLQFADGCKFSILRKLTIFRV